MNNHCTGDQLLECIRLFLSELSSFPIYGTSENPDIPMTAELALLNTIERSNPISHKEVQSIRARLNYVDECHLVTFAVRMAILAARTNTISDIRSGTLGLVIDNGIVDGREILIQLSIVEDCALRLGTDLESIVRPHIHLATEKRRETIVDGYLSRTPGMRGLKIMGVAVSGHGSNLKYRQLSWAEIEHGRGG